jgi:hypothetical protein
MFGIGINAGVQKSFGNYKRVEPYVGIDLSLIYSYSSEKRETISTRTNGYESKSESKNPLQLNFVVLPLIGLNYYITPGLAIGAEYRLSVASVQYNANAESESTYKWISTNDISTSKTKQDQGTLSFNGAFRGTGFITLTFFLR